MIARDIVIEGRKKIVVGLIAVLTAFAMFAVVTQEVNAENISNGQCGDNVLWNYDNSTRTLTISGTGDMYDYEYEWYELDPVNYKGAPWTEYFDEMEKIVVEEGITGIGNYAFTSMFKHAKNVSEAILPSTLVKIGDSAFYDCGEGGNVSELKVTLPVGLKTIGETAFANTKIKSIKIPDGVKRLNRTFDGCKYLEQIDLGKVEEIGGHTFWQCQALKNITLPNTLKKIEDSVFGGTQISEIVIPEGVSSLGREIYDPIYGTQYMPTFVQCEYLQKVVIPSTLTYIAGDEFGMCDNFKELDYRGTEEQWRQLTRGIDPNSSLGAIINDPTIKKEYNYGNNKINNTPTTPKKILANPMTVKGKTVTVKYKKLTKKTQSVKRSKAITVSKAQGKVTYKKVSVTYTKAKSVKMSKKALKSYKKKAAKKITINAKTGKVTVKKSLKKGTYKVKIKVNAAGNANYYAATKTVTVKIRVK